MTISYIALDICSVCIWLTYKYPLCIQYMGLDREETKSRSLRWKSGRKLVFGNWRTLLAYRGTIKASLVPRCKVSDKA